MLKLEWGALKSPREVLFEGYGGGTLEGGDICISIPPVGQTHTQSISIAHPVLAGLAQRSGELGLSSLSLVITFQAPPEMMTRPSPQAFSQIFKHPRWAQRQRYKQKKPPAAHRSAARKGAFVHLELARDTGGE